MRRGGPRPAPHHPSQLLSWESAPRGAADGCESARRAPTSATHAPRPLRRPTAKKSAHSSHGAFGRGPLQPRSLHQQTVGEAQIPKNLPPKPPSTHHDRGGGSNPQKPPAKTTPRLRPPRTDPHPSPTPKDVTHDKPRIAPRRLVRIETSAAMPASPLTNAAPRTSPAHRRCAQD
jgi:hypothetical protein